MTKSRISNLALVVAALSVLMAVPLAVADETLPQQSAVVTRGPLPCLWIDPDTIPPDVSVIESCWMPAV